MSYYDITSIRFNGQSYNLAGKQGPQGPKGDKGEDGVSTDFKYAVMTLDDYNALSSKDSKTLYIIPL